MADPVNAQASRPQTVIVVGGGVAGLTAAQELAERGYNVTVYETRDILGGKARSVQVPDTAPPGGHALPGEHGFRFLPACYFHLPDTMSRIPRRDGKTVAQHLVPAEEILFATYDNEPFCLPLGFSFEKLSAPGGVRDQAKQLWKLVTFLPGLLRLEEKGTFLTAADLAFYTSKLWEILTTCRDRRIKRFEHLPWWKFLDADARSHAYQKYLAIGLTRNLVACKAEKANTLTIGQIAVQMVLSIFNPQVVDRVLDGPTNDVWINPWREYLENPNAFPHPAAFKHPVKFVTKRELAKIEFDPATNTVAGIKVRAPSRRIERVRGKVREAIAEAEKDPDIAAIADIWKRTSAIQKRATVARLAAEAWENAHPEPPAPLEEATADVYVFALPVEQISSFVTPEIERADPQLKGLRTLREQVDWMSGIQFYLTDRPDLPAGHVDFLDTEWALTSIMQDERLWPNGLGHYGDGTVKHILSVDISDWAAKDPQGREAWDLPPLDVAREVWRQLQQSLNREGIKPVLRDDMMHKKYRWYLDDDIDERIEPHRHEATLANGKPDLLVNAEPLLVNYAGSRALRPQATTKIKNLFLASDYVLTNTELATMEAANEAAREAVNGILKLTPPAFPPCVTKPFYEPLQFLRDWDKRRLDRHKNWSLGCVNPLFTVGTFIAVTGCQTLVAARNLLFPPRALSKKLSTSSPLHAPGPASRS